jgi:pilus assembly protein CpaB
MRFTILGLITIGIIAALAAAVLAASLRAESLDLGPSSDVPHEVTVCVAARDLPAMTVVDAQSLEETTIMSDQLPEGAMRSPVQIVGQIVIVPVVKGQPFTLKTFATDEAGLHLAATLPEGGRAMTVLLSDQSGIEGLLYPGSIVDVVASFRLPSVPGSPAGQVVSATLLQSVRVLAVGGRSIVSKHQDPEEVASSQIDRRRERLVTLLVNPEQAEALQLATEHGEISLALRNPLDEEVTPSHGVMLTDLSEEIAKRLAGLAASNLPATSLGVQQIETAPPVLGSSLSNNDPDVTDDGGEATDAESRDPVIEEPTPVWTMLVMRGRNAKAVSFPIEETDSALEHDE